MRNWDSLMNFSPLKEGCNRGDGLSATIKPRAQILAVWLQTDLQPIKQNLCLAPDQKMVRPKKVANYLKINLALKKNGL